MFIRIRAPIDANLRQIDIHGVKERGSELEFVHVRVQVWTLSVSCFNGKMVVEVNTTVIASSDLKFRPGNMTDHFHWEQILPKEVAVTDIDAVYLTLQFILEDLECLLINLLILVIELNDDLILMLTEHGLYLDYLPLLGMLNQIFD